MPVFGLHQPVAVFDWLPLQVLSVLPLLCSGSAARPVVTLVAELVHVALQGQGVAELVLVALAAAEELAELVLVPLVPVSLVLVAELLAGPKPWEWP